MRILFIAALHHPDVLQAAIAATPPGGIPPLFPPSVAQHFWEKTLRKRGHILDVFYRNLSAFGGSAKAHHHSQDLTPGKIATAVLQRISPRLNPDYRLRNQRLIQKALAFRPDVLWMTGDNAVIYPQTLAFLKEKTACKLVYGCGTSPIVFAPSNDKQAAPLYDLVLANDYYHGIQWLELGAKHMECLPLSACDPDFHRHYELSEAEHREYHCEVAFVGTLVPSNLYSRRVKALEALRDFDLGIWSVHDVPPDLERFVRGQALGETTLRILSAAKINLNPNGDFMRYGGNMRLFEIAGVGGFQLADESPGIAQWFTEGENIVTYRDLDDLRQKVTYYLSHEMERQMIAQRGQDHVYYAHTYDQRSARLDELLSTLEET